MDSSNRTTQDMSAATPSNDPSSSAATAPHDDDPVMVATSSAASSATTAAAPSPTQVATPPLPAKNTIQPDVTNAATNGDKHTNDPTANAGADETATKPKPGTASALGKSYLEIVQEAIAEMNDRTGSSLASIKKWIAANYGSLMENPQFTGRLNKAIRNGVSTKKLLKVRASYKLNQTATPTATVSNKKRKATDSSREQASFEKKLQGLAPEVAEQMRKAKAEEDRQRQKKEMEIAERLRKRRFPMEDTKLHAEDKQLKVKPPSKVKSRPALPYFWHIPLPLDHPDRRGKTPGLILTYSKADALDVDSRGLVPDLLQVYHFFRGDVHFYFSVSDENERDSSGIVPDFTLRHLIFAVDQIISGNARKAKQVPPLIVHLFVTCLQILLSGIGSYSSRNEAHMYAELHKYLQPALTPVSWPDICHLYMDAMERYYTSEASLEPNVLETEPLSVEYLFGKTDTMETTKIEGSRGYLGHTNGSLYKAHHKLAKLEPWNLTAEELMAVLRALTEDVLALHPEILDHREEHLQELAKNKRAADAKLRKVRLAYEGPPKKENGKSSNGEKEVPFVPTTSKRQYDAAKRAQEQASQQYQEGCRSMVARTLPIGQDRHFNEVYSFGTDPDILFVEERRPAANPSGSKIPAALLPGRRSWHAIETMSLFDSFIDSLDVRGKRENDLYNELAGRPEESPRQFLIDDVSLVAKAEEKKKEIDRLEKRLEEVRKMCEVAESSRRSTRQGLQPEEELTEIEDALARLKEREDVPPLAGAVHNIYDLTGLHALEKFEKEKDKKKRRARDTAPQNLPLLHCSRIRATGEVDGTGLIGMIVHSLKDLEEHCDNLSPWARKDQPRDRWLSRLEGCVTSWNALSSRSIDTPPTMASRSSSTPIAASPSLNGNTSQSSDRQMDTPSQNGHGTCSSPHPAQSSSTIMGILKELLLDLEERVADITNLALATRDADLADDNMSTQSEQETSSNSALLNLWKKRVKQIQHTPTKRYAKIRELLVVAIADARKAHLPTVVAQLRAALLKYRPTALSSDCKDAAVQVLEDHGGYNPNEDDVVVVDDKEGPTPNDELPSVVSAEAVTLGSSLDGTDDSRREDWVEAVRSARTFSRLAALCAGFVNDATERVTKLSEEHRALQTALVEWKKPPKEVKPKRRGAPPKVFKDPSEVWADVHITDDICMVKAADFPWWPAKKCIAKDSFICQDLEEVNRSLVAFIGEMGAIRVVTNDNIKPFDGNTVVEEGVDYTKDMKSQLDDCMAMARRMIRGIQKRSNGGTVHVETG